MAGIYIHIPFCKKACHYCNFHFSTSTKYINEMVQAICTEAQLRSDYISEPVETIYFGGGTPSVLSAFQLQNILAHLYNSYEIKEDTEITLEANPDDINLEKLNEWKKASINRLSIGIQSFFDADLQWMNRAHNALQAKQSILLAQEAGFNNITIDLIYGTPTLSDEKWEQNVDQAIELNIPHLSCYALTVEPKTALDKMIQQHKLPDIDPEKQSHHFELLMQWMKKAGYEHYEISNFAKPLLRSKHNSSYWQGKNYLGLGPSAHSYNGNSRQWNIANNALYIKSLEQKTVPFEKEELNVTQRLNEYIMTSFRTIEGLALNHVAANWDKETADALRDDAQQWIKQGKMQSRNEALVLTNKGKLFADGIAAAMFR